MNPQGPQRLRACSMVFQDVNYQLFADSVRTEVSFGLTDAEAPDAARGRGARRPGAGGGAERHPATLSAARSSASPWRPASPPASASSCSTSPERARPGQHAHGGGARAPVGRRGPRRARGHP
ncbi:MAG: hypothetical protein ACLSVD_00425 [Eggerthellaceae bacterium]